MRRPVDTSNWQVSLPETHEKVSYIGGRTIALRLMANFRCRAEKHCLQSGKPEQRASRAEVQAGLPSLKEWPGRCSWLESVVHLNGWPADESIFDGAAAIMIYADGGDGHPA